MSNEPGLTLGRLIAAERNGLAALQLAEKLSLSNNTQMATVENLAKQVLQLRAELHSIRALAAAQYGHGSTTE